MAGRSLEDQSLDELLGRVQGLSSMAAASEVQSIMAVFAKCTLKLGKVAGRLLPTAMQTNLRSRCWNWCETQDGDASWAAMREPASRVISPPPSWRVVTKKCMRRFATVCINKDTVNRK